METLLMPDETKLDTSKEAVRRLSDDVLCIAQAMPMGATDYAYKRLLSAGLVLRRLAGVPMPWEDGGEFRDRPPPVPEEKGVGI
jgi:hypothetical protein